jgi:hypothetical protein
VQISELSKSDGTNKANDSLWANKNYQFNTKEPSFYQSSTPQNDRKVVKKINFATQQAEKCANCNKTVYPLEEIKLKNSSYHKSCLKCHTCKKLLEKNTLNEHESKIFCKSCHAKLLILPVKPADSNKMFDNFEQVLNDANEDDTSQSCGYQAVLGRKSVPNIKLKIQANNSHESDFKSIKNLLKPVASKNVNNSSKRNR